MVHENEAALLAQIYLGDSGTGWDEYSNPAGHWLAGSATIDFDTIPTETITNVSFELTKNGNFVAKWVCNSPTTYMNAYKKYWGNPDSIEGISGTQYWEVYFPSTDVEGIKGNVIVDDTDGTTITRPADFTPENYSIENLGLVITVTTATDKYISSWPKE